MTAVSPAVFLSYASEDAEAARRICEALRAAGIEVWFDQSELRGGDVWDRQIRKQIHDCALFVPIISAHSDGRTEGYFRLEWKLAVDRSHLMADDATFLLPVVIDDTTDATARVPDKFRTVQWSRLPAGTASPAFVERLSRLLSPGQTPSVPIWPPVGTTPAPSRSAPGATVSRWKQPAVVLIGTVAVVGASYFAVDKFWPSKGAAAPVFAPTVQSALPIQSTIPEKSIAVLPFVDMSEKHDQEYFADGMAEEILNLLVKIPELKVIGRTSSFQFKGKADDLRKIGTTLGAAYVVEGSVRRSGDHIRVTAQLIDARDGAHRWSETYDRNASDVLRVQNEIGTTLVRELQLEVSSVSHLPRRTAPLNEEAYDTYLRGQHALNRFDQRGFEEAAADYRRALKADPLFSPAADGLAMSLANLADWGFVPPQVGWEQARAAAEAALKLDANSPVAHMALGSVYTFYDWNWAAAHREFAAAVALAPNDSPVLVRAARERLAVADWSQALRYVDTASTADPLDATAYLVRAWAYTGMGRLDEAERSDRRVMEVAPTFSGGHYNLGVVLLMEGKTAETLSQMQLEDQSTWNLSGLALAYHALHRKKDSDKALARLIARNAFDSAVPIAEVYSYRDEKDKAFAWLETAFEQKDPLLWFIKADPLFRGLEGDARYKAFLRKMNLPE